MLPLVPVYFKTETKAPKNLERKVYFLVVQPSNPSDGMNQLCFWKVHGRSCMIVIGQS
jgi:hypothetical protein